MILNYPLFATLYFSPKPRKHVVTSAKGREVDGFTEFSGYLFELNNTEANFLKEYSPSKIAAVYKKRPFTVLRRVVQVGATLGVWFAQRYIDGVMERSELMFKVRAAELRKILVQLGPAYIKIAQAISSRSDLVPPSYLNELSLLQDRVSPFSTDVAFSTIERELGVPIEELFSMISPEPLAAASLGQVYQARLRNSRKLVAVKVQRPGVQAAISLDILILRFLAGLVRKAGKFNTDLEAVVDEWASSLFQEMDYTEEAENGLKFRQLYGGIKDVVVPEMYMEKTTSRVLVMQWIEGQRLSEVNDLYLVEIGVYCSFNQLLECGFYHADPHPGNLLRTSDGKLAYLDFGMMGVFKQELRDGFMEACIHLVNRDYDALAEDFVTLGLLPPTADKDDVTTALTGVFKDAVAKGVQNISFGDLLGNLGTTIAESTSEIKILKPGENDYNDKRAIYRDDSSVINHQQNLDTSKSELVIEEHLKYKFKFQIPSYFYLVIRSLAVLEGIAIGINPNYKVLGSTYPYIARKVLMDSSPKLQASLQALLYKDGVFRIDRLESLLTEALRAKTEKALVKKSMEDNDSKMATIQILQFTLTGKGTFVKELLLQELTKGLDALGLATLDSVTANLPFVSTTRNSSLTEEDVISLRTLQRLVLLLSNFQSEGESSSSSSAVVLNNQQSRQSTEASIMLSQFASVREYLPLFFVIFELPPDLQQEVLRLPADLAGKLMSRIVARTLRRALL